MKKQLLLMILISFAAVAALLTGCAGTQKASDSNFMTPEVTLSQAEVPSYFGYWFYDAKVQPTQPANAKPGNNGAPLIYAFVFNVKNPNDFPVLMDNRSSPSPWMGSISTRWVPRQHLPFSYLHIFPFSVRAKTRASKMPGQVASRLKKERYHELNLLNTAMKKEYSESQIGRSLDIIVEEIDKDKTATGTSSNYLRVQAMGNTCAVKSLITVGITGSEKNILIGKPLQLK